MIKLVAIGRRMKILETFTEARPISSIDRAITTNGSQK